MNKVTHNLLTFYMWQLSNRTAVAVSYRNLVCRMDRLQSPHSSHQEMVWELSDSDTMRPIIQSGFVTIALAWPDERPELGNCDLGIFHRTWRQAIVPSEWFFSNLPAAINDALAMAGWKYGNSLIAVWVAAKVPIKFIFIEIGDRYVPVWQLLRIPFSCEVDDPDAYKVFGGDGVRVYSDPHGHATYANVAKLWPRQAIVEGAETLYECKPIGSFEGWTYFRLTGLPLRITNKRTDLDQVIEPREDTEAWIVGLS